MPLPIAHGLLGATIVAALHPRPEKLGYAPFLVGVILANAADFDFLLVFLFHSKAWHRGFTHSLFFAFGVCFLWVWFLGGKRLQEALAYGLAYASHGILDYATCKEGGGVQLLYPFSAERFKLGWAGLSEVPSSLPATGVLKALILEFILFAPLLLLALYLRKLTTENTGAGSAADGA